MPVYDWYPTRKREADRAGQAEVYHYDDLPTPLRVQVVRILREALGRDHSHAEERWRTIYNVVTREMGVLALGPDPGYEQKCCIWLLHKAETDNALGMIELSFSWVDEIIGKWDELKRKQEGISITADDAIKELNARFRQHGVGYQFESGHIIRVDSQYIHSEVVKPALALINDSRFAKVEEDFLTAHRHFREGHHKDCVAAAQRAFEGALKAICAEQRWDYRDGDRASELLTVVRRNGLFPEYLGKGFDTYVAMLKTGLPEIRNNAGGHGEAPEAPLVPSFIAAYALHMSATNIVLLVEAMKTLGKTSG